MRLTMMMCGGLIRQVSLSILPFEEEAVKDLDSEQNPVSDAKCIAVQSGLRTDIDQSSEGH